MTPTSQRVSFVRIFYLLEAAAIDWLAAGMTGCRLCDERIARPYSTIKLNGRLQQFKAGATATALRRVSNAFPCTKLDVS